MFKHETDFHGSESLDHGLLGHNSMYPWLFGSGNISSKYSEICLDLQSATFQLLTWPKFKERPSNITVNMHVLE
jgi:hypothetical protein